MIIISLLIMIALIIAAGATQFWLLAYIGVGVFLITLLMYLMAINDVFNAIVLIIVAIAAPVLYLQFKQDWILYLSYIAVGLWINSGTITDNDVFIEWTFEGKVYEFFDERATDFLISLFSFIYAAIWGLLAFVSIQFGWFLLIPSLYLIIRSLVILIKARDYSLTHSFMLIDDVKDFFSSFKDGITNFFVGKRSSERKFSWWNFILPILLVGLSIGLVYLEIDNTYSDFSKNLELTDLFSSSKWFYFTSVAWNLIPEACESLSDSIPFFGAILSIPLAIVLFILVVIVAIIEVVLSLIWVIICLLTDHLLPWIIGFTLLYIAPALLPIGALILLILSFTLNHSMLNRMLNIIGLIITAIGCYYYFVYMMRGNPIIPLSFLV